MNPLAALFAALLRCVLLATGSSLVGAACSQLGVWGVALFTSVLFGMLSLGIPGGLLDGNKTPCMVVAFLCLVTVSAAGFMAMAMVEHRLWPGLVRDLGVTQAGEHRWASAFEFRDGTVRADLGGDQDIRGRYRNAVDTAFVVPVVPAGWTKDQPIAVWAVANRNTLAECRERWQQPLRAGARVVGFHLADRRAAVRSACAVHHLTATSDPVFIDWRARPGDAVAESWQRLATIAAIAVAIMVVSLLVAWPMAPAPAGR